MGLVQVLEMGFGIGLRVGVQYGVQGSGLRFSMGFRVQGFGLGFSVGCLVRV